jgi:hypothetical protein
VRIFSFGGGVQSNAVMVLAAQGRVQYDAFIFANVGEDSENPETLEYIEKYTKPFMADHGLKFVEVRKTLRCGKAETLRQFMERTKTSIPIPMRLETGAPGNRTCTVDYKILVIDRWAKKNGAVGSFTVGLGISTDEIHRARTDGRVVTKGGLERIKEYPLIDLRLSRNDCHTIIREAGLPQAPKSSCYFCPFHSDLAWYDIRQRFPALFADACYLESLMQNRRRELGKDAVWMHRKLIPLARAIPDQPFLFAPDDLENCESGYCMV